MTARPAPLALSLVLLAGAVLAGCSPDRVTTGSTYPVDYRERHPIVLTDAPRTLDLFVNAPGGLDARQRGDVHAFAAEYRQHGQGGLVVQAPVGGRNDAAAQILLGAVRTALAQSGIPAELVTVSTYAVADPAVAAPVRVSFRRLQAKVGSRCGLWPQDLGVADARFSTRNDPYWNLGCATQANMAAQVADPVDLVRGRPEGRIDTLRRARDFDSIRQGKDPSTQYRQDDKNRINQAVGN